VSGLSEPFEMFPIEEHVRFGQVFSKGVRVPSRGTEDLVSNVQPDRWSHGPRAQCVPVESVEPRMQPAARRSVQRKFLIMCMSVESVDRVFEPWGTGPFLAG
jgi:hypothetical protein